MKKIVRLAFLIFAAVAASATYGAIPSMKVLVSDENGYAAYRGTTDSKGMFSTGTLKPGRYVVQFKANRNDVEGSNYALVVSAGRKKVVADVVAGEKFAGGGVAMRIAVAGGASIVGQVASDLGTALVWIPRQVDSNLPAHWATADSAEARFAQTRPSYRIKDIQDKQNQGVGLR